MLQIGFQSYYEFGSGSCALEYPSHHYSANGSFLLSYLSLSSFLDAQARAF